MVEKTGTTRHKIHIHKKRNLCSILILIDALLLAGAVSLVSRQSVLSARQLRADSNVIETRLKSQAFINSPSRNVKVEAL